MVFTSALGAAALISSAVAASLSAVRLMITTFSPRFASALAYAFPIPCSNVVPRGYPRKGLKLPSVCSFLGLPETNPRSQLSKNPHPSRRSPPPIRRSWSVSSLGAQYS